MSDSLRHAPVPPKLKKEKRFRFKWLLWVFIIATILFVIFYYGQ